MIRIVHLITNLTVGGTENMLLKLLERIDRSRFSNVVVSLKGAGAVGKKIEEIQIPFVGLYVNSGFGIAGLLYLQRMLRKYRPHILQTWLYHADLVGLFSGKMCGVPAIVWNVRSSALKKTDHPVHLRAILKVLARISSIPDAVVVNSRAGMQSNTELGFKPRRWELIPNGFDLEAFRPSAEARDSVRRELGLEEYTRLIGLVARYDPMKDHTTFLRAARILQAQEPDLHFLLIGSGVTAANHKLFQLVCELGLQRCVHLLGERSDVDRITASLDVATCSSYSEGFPNVIGEAMACGVPCVSTDVGDCSEIIGEAGIIVPPEDASSLAAGWKRLLEMLPEEKKQLGLVARARIASLFNIDRVVAQYENLYEGLVNLA